MKFQLLQFFTDYLNLPKVAFTCGWDFFGIPNPKPDQKSRKSRNPRDRDIKTSQKSRKSRNPRDRDIKTSQKSRKNPEYKIPKIPKSRESGSEFENPEEIPKNPEAVGLFVKTLYMVKNRRLI